MNSFQEGEKKAQLWGAGDESNGFSFLSSTSCQQHRFFCPPALLSPPPLLKG